MADEEAIRRKHDLLAAAMHEYFWHIGAELTARWTKAMLGLPPSILRELAGRLQELEDVTNQTNRELKAAGLATAEGRESAEHLLNRALASMEHLTEVAEAMTRRLAELLTALTDVEMVEADNTSPRHLVLTMMHLGRGSSAVLRRRGEG